MVLEEFIQCSNPNHCHVGSEDDITRPDLARTERLRTRRLSHIITSRVYNLTRRDHER